jgi:hypothetical protein
MSELRETWSRFLVLWDKVFDGCEAHQVNGDLIINGRDERLTDEENKFFKNVLRMEIFQDSITALTDQLMDQRILSGITDLSKEEMAEIELISSIAEEVFTDSPTSRIKETNLKELDIESVNTRLQQIINELDEGR